MLELGERSGKAHQIIADRVGEKIDLVYTFGDSFKEARFCCHRIHLDSAEDLDLDKLAAHLDEGSAVLVKGSNKVFWDNDFVPRLTKALT